MAFERRWPAVPSVQFTAPGTSQGIITITSASGFKVKQLVWLVNTSLGKVPYQVKRVTSPTSMELGDPNKNFADRSDLSAYDATSSVYADEQPRPKIPPGEAEQATYEEEPTVARREVLVDEFGRKIGQSNPLPITGNISVESFNYDAFNLSYDSDKNLHIVQYYLLGNLIRTVTLNRDSDGDITSGTRVS